MLSDQRDEAEVLRRELSAAHARAERLEADLTEVHEQHAERTEQAAGLAMVKTAERRAVAAEKRAGNAEIRMRELGSMVTGEIRQLTAAEITELRDKGPAGPGIFATALKNLARARSGRGSMHAALTEIARAALNWRDRLS
jgi:hypothetical protein